MTDLTIEYRYICREYEQNAWRHGMNEEYAGCDWHEDSIDDCAPCDGKTCPKCGGKVTTYRVAV